MNLDIRNTRRALVLAGAFVALLVVAGSAAAHAVLIRAEPAIGARVSSAPRVIALVFNEPVGLADHAITITDAAGQRIAVGQAHTAAAGRVVHASLPAPAAGRGSAGVFIVSWRVVSADGDRVDGKYQFAVGHGRPANASQTSLTDPLPPADTTLAQALTLLGLALAIGALWSASTLGTSRTLRRAGLAGLAAAATSRLVIVLDQAAGRRGTSLAHMIVNPSTRGLLEGRAAQAAAAAAALFTLAAALTATTRSWARRTGLAVGAGGIVATVAGGHAGDLAPAPLAIAIWALHLGAASAWLGMLAALAWVVLRRDALDEDVLRRALRRYTLGALSSIVVLAASGAYLYWKEVRRLSLLSDTTYGQLLSIKTIGFALALLLAATARRFALASQGRASPTRLRGVARGESVVVALIVLTAAVLVGAVPSRSQDLARGIAALGLPPPPGPALRTATLIGPYTVYAAARRDGLVLDILDVDGTPLEHAHVEVALKRPGGRAARPSVSPCLAGCFLAHTSLPSGTSTAEIAITNQHGRTARGSLELRWPLPPQGQALLRGVVSTMRRQPSMVIRSLVTSDTSRPTPAPLELRLTGRELVKDQLYSPDGAIDVRLVGRTRRDGRDLRILSYLLPGAGISFALWIGSDERIYHEVDVTPRHLITLDYHYSTPAR